jgi:trans-aconitate methyltransferase
LEDSLSTWARREARRIEKARTLLRGGAEDMGGTWADLGCGDGIFTAALHTLLQPGSEIYAVENFAEGYPEASIHPLLADFTRSLSLPPLDGLVMANSLHFVRHKRPVLVRIVDLLEPGGRLILVEYNATRGNFAVPYPLDEVGFLNLAGEVGLDEARILEKIPSSFMGEMYAGMGLAG